MIEINQITINHMTEPLGYDLDNHLRVAFNLTNSATMQDTKKRIVVKADKEIYDSNWQVYKNNFFDFALNLQPRTRYELTIYVKNANDESSKSSFFETGKMAEPFTASWIGNNDKDIQNTLLTKKFTLTKPVKSARLYMTGLGVYEAYLNNEKVGNELLAPGTTAYDQLIQVQTYDVTKPLQKSANQELLISLGDGWYKGNFGFDGGQDNIYGNRQMAIAELHIQYTDN